MEITIFKDIKVTSQPFYRGALVILNRIKEGASKDLVKRIREEKDKEKVNTLNKSYLLFVSAVSLLSVMINH